MADAEHYGLLAEFGTPEALIEAAKKARTSEHWHRATAIVSSYRPYGGGSPTRSRAACR